MTGQWTRNALWVGVLAAIAWGGHWIGAGAERVPGAGAERTHVVMTSEQDRQRMMDQLKITMFPSGPGAVSGVDLR